MMKLLLTDTAAISSNNDLSLELFNRFGSVVSYEAIDRETLLQRVGEFDAVLCNKTVIDRAVLEAAPHLRYIGLFATGYNNIDIDCARERGVTVCNAGGYSTDAVAQQVFAYLLAHFSAVGRYNELVQQGGWISSPTFSMLCYPTDELAGKTIGIIGFGSIGQRVAEISAAFGMRVLVFTRTPRETPGVTFVSLDELLTLSDIVTVHCPLNEQSRLMFCAETFSKMRDGAYFINTARGGIVDEHALLEALISGKLSGAAVDVLSTEPMKSDCPLLGAPNLIITPHTAWAPLSTRRRLLEIVADNLRCFLENRPQNKIT